MTTESENQNIILDNSAEIIEEETGGNRQFLESTIITLKKSGYKIFKSTYFAALRHKYTYYKPYYFDATPEQKICIIDIIILKTTLKKREQIITEFELLNRDCQEIRSILQKEYQNSSRIFGDELFGIDDYTFINLLVYKKIKGIPIYNDSFQVVFSVKPLIVTENGGSEFDLQQDSRIDMVSVAHLPQYLQYWRKEVVNLGSKVYNKKKLLHHTFQNTFDKMVLWAAILWLIPTELNIFLMWNLWYFSFQFIIFLVIFIVVVMYVHSFIRYKFFSKACKKEITSPNWVSQCNYLTPFMVRSRQLLVQPLENRKAPVSQNLKAPQNLTQIFNAHPTTAKPQPRPTAEVIQTSVTTSNGQTKEEKVIPSQKETPPPLPQNIPKPSGRGILKLLARQPKFNVNLEVYKQQLGDLYAKLKITTDFETFKQSSLKIIALMLTSLWYKLTGNPPMNIRIKEVSDKEIDYFSQVENLLRQFLDKYPDTLDVEETYRIATIINIGQLNQKTIEHIEWKIDDWLLNFQLLPEDKLKVLYATHTRRTTSPDKPAYNAKELPNLPPVVKPVAVNKDSADTVKREQVSNEKPVIEDSQIQTNTDTNTNSNTKNAVPDKSNNEEKQVNLENPTTSGNLNLVKKWLNQNEEDISKPFIGDDIKSYYRFKKVIQGEGIEKISLPLCILILDSRLHPVTCVQEFIEVSHRNTGIVFYAIFDYNRIKPDTWENEEIEPLEFPTILIKDFKTGFERKFDFSASRLAETLATMRDSFKNKGSTAPIISNTNPNTEPNEFETIEENTNGNLMDLGDLKVINTEAEHYPEIPENIEQTAQIYESGILDPSENKGIIQHSYAFNGDNLFQIPGHNNQGIVIDANNILHSFLTNLDLLRTEHNITPDFYLLEVFDRIHLHLISLGFGPILYYTGSSFYIYLLCEPEKIEKIEKNDKKATYREDIKQSFYSYHSTKEEYDFYQITLRHSCFYQVYKGRDSDNRMISHAVGSEYKILSNDGFSQAKYRQFGDYISKNRFTFEISQSVMTIYDPMNRPLGEPFFLINLPKNVINTINQGNLEKPVKEYSSNISVKNEIFNIDSEEENKVLTVDKKWIQNSKIKSELISPSQNTQFNHIKNSVLEIVYGAFHTKKGAIVIFPLCKNCTEKFIHNKGEQEQPTEFDLSAHLKLTNCDCPLPNTRIPREEARNHLDDALKSDKFNTIEGKYTYCAWRWKLSQDQIPRQELSWAIVIYMDPQNPLYNKERVIIREFLKGYQFNVGDDLQELLNQGLNQEELDVKFYEKLYDRLEDLTIELSTTINNIINV